MSDFAHALSRSWSRSYYLDAIAPLLFLLILISLFAMGAVGAIHYIAIPALWVSMLLACVLGCQTTFDQAFSTGVLSLWVAERTRLIPLLLAEVVVRLCLVWLALFLGCAIAALWLGLDRLTLLMLWLGMTLSLPAMGLLITWAGTLLLGAKQGAWILFLMVMPLLIPIALFGIRLTEQAALGVIETQGIMMLAGLSILAIALLPWVLKWSIQLAAEH